MSLAFWEALTEASCRLGADIKQQLDGLQADGWDLHNCLRALRSAGLSEVKVHGDSCCKHQKAHSSHLRQVGGFWNITGKTGFWKSQAIVWFMGLPSQQKISQPPMLCLGLLVLVSALQEVGDIPKQGFRCDTSWKRRGPFRLGDHGLVSEPVPKKKRDV